MNDTSRPDEPEDRLYEPEPRKEGDAPYFVSFPPEGPPVEGDASEERREEGTERRSGSGAPVDADDLPPPLEEAYPVPGSTAPAFQVLTAAPRRRQSRVQRTFDFGGVFSNVFKVYGRMWLSVVILSAIFIAPGSLLSVKIQSDLFGLTDRWGTEAVEAEDVEAEDYDPYAAGRSANRSLAFFSGLQIFQMVMNMVLAGTISFVVVRHQQGRPVGVGEAVARGVKRFFPIAGTLLWVSLLLAAMIVPGVVLIALDATGLGVLLLFLAAIPMIMYWLSVFVAAPCCAVEKLSPVASVARSRALCIGYRGQLFGLLFVLGLVTGGINLVTQIPFLAAGASPGAGGHSLGGLLATSVVEVLVVSPLAAILYALAYVELRRVKEGVDPDGIVDVFA
jgi:hypothetical protein